MFGAIATELAVHPIHVRRKPIARHKDHALLNLLQHGIELRASGTHLSDHLISVLRDDRREKEVIAIDIESLREGEGPSAVDGVISAWAKVARVGLDLGVTPLVALPIWVAAVVSGASVICDLLHLHVSLVHIEFCAAPQPRKALRVTIMVMVLALSWPWHVYQIEIHIAPARWSIPLEVNVHTERLARKVGHVEVLCVAVVCSGTLHEIVPVVRRRFEGLAIVHYGCPRQVVRFHHAVLIDQNPTCFCASQ